MRLIQDNPAASRNLSVFLLVSAVVAIAVTMTCIAFTMPLIAFGLLYVTGFLMLAFWRPEFALALVVATAPFQNDLSGNGSVKFSIAEVNLGLLVPVYVLRGVLSRKRYRWGPLAIPVMLYLAICVFSSLMRWDGMAAIISLTQMVLYMALAVMVFATLVPQAEKMLYSYYGLIVVGIFMALMGVVTHQQYFLGLHKNGIGSSLGCAVVVCLELWFATEDAKRKRWLAIALGILVIGLVWQLSRGAWLAALAGYIVIVALRRQYDLLWKGALILIPAVAVCWNLLPQDSKEYATGFGSERQNIQARYDSVDLAVRYFKESPWYGNGVGLRKDYDATNIFWLTLAETGVLGVVTFLGIQGSVLRMVWLAQKPLARNDARFSVVAIGGALAVGHMVHGMVDHYWSRGALMICWASVGMATSVYLATARWPVRSASETLPETRLKAELT